MDEKLLNEFDALLALAIREDLGDSGDISSQAVFGLETAKARIIAREDVVVYGLWAVERLCAKHAPGLVFTALCKDGDFISTGSVLCRFEGSVLSILSLERCILNFLGFLSGISTRTRRFVDIAASYGTTKILDTRKTLPGWRLLSKAAVLAGGGTNHRLGLYDMVMLKDNHLDAAGGMSKAVLKVRDRYAQNYRIEVECRTLTDVREALDLQVDVAMLDNMDEVLCAEAVELRRRHKYGKTLAFEASGDMSLERLPLFAGLGLDFISVGALTHSVKNANLSLGMEKS